MSENKIAEARSLLTPGSVWLSAKGKPSHVLFVTNESIPSNRANEFPPQVVFADEEGELFNVGIDRFLGNRTFFNVDGELESRIENLLVFNEDEEEDDDAPNPPEGYVDPAEEDEDDEEDEHELTAEEEDLDDVEQEVKRGLKAVFQFDNTPGLEKPVLNSLQLEKALRFYSQDPLIERSQLQHRLTFVLGGDVSLDSLSATFDPNIGAASNTRAITAFTISTGDELEATSWDEYLGVYPVYTDTGAFGAVLLGTDVVLVRPAQEPILSVAEEQIRAVEEVQNPMPIEAYEQGRTVSVQDEPLFVEVSHVTQVVPQVAGTLTTTPVPEGGPVIIAPEAPAPQAAPAPQPVVVNVV